MRTWSGQRQEVCRGKMKVKAEEEGGVRTTNLRITTLINCGRRRAGLAIEGLGRNNVRGSTLLPSATAPIARAPLSPQGKG